MGDYSLDILQYITPKKYFDKKYVKYRKRRITKLQLQNMIRRTSRMFEWKGLPDTIPQRVLELNLQTRGVVGFIEQQGKHYAVWGALGDKSNYNYMPTKFIVANPYLPEKQHTYNIYDDGNEKKDVVIIPNDTLYQGLIPLLSYHCELLTEVQLTKRCLFIFNRVPTALTAPDNNAFESIKSFLSDLDEGEIASIFDKNFMRDVSTLQMTDGARNLITQMLEAEQYQKAAMFNDIGLQMNYNMKRETITSSEAQLGESALLPLCDDMLEMRQIACKEIKELFGLDISVDFSSAWKDLRKNIELETKKIENEVQNEEAQQVQTFGQDEQEQSQADSDVPKGDNDEQRDADDTSKSNADTTEPERGDTSNEEPLEIIEQAVEEIQNAIEDMSDETEETT